MALKGFGFRGGGKSMASRSENRPSKVKNKPAGKGKKIKSELGGFNGTFGFR